MVFYETLRHQDWLIPPRIEDIIDEDHVCFLVEIVVDEMDFSDIEKKHEGPGHPAYPPRGIIKTIVMGMIDGVRPARKLAKNARENVVYMYLAEKLQPNFRTISDFRKENQELIDDCFKTVVLYARDLGMVQLGHVSIDGSKFKANASKSKTFTKDELRFLDEFIQNEIRQGILEDEMEDKLFGRDKTGYELPDDVKSAQSIKKELKKKFKESGLNEKSTRRVKKLAEDYIDGDDAKKQTIEAKIKDGLEQLEDSDIKRLNLTDPDSRLMKDKKGVFGQEYNGQIAVDAHEKIIIAADISQSAVDTNELIPMIGTIEDIVGELKEGTELSLDNGYFSGENVAYMEERKFDGYIPDSDQSQKMKGKSPKKNPFGKESFDYDEQNDWFICPNGKVLTSYYEYYDKRQGKTIRGYRCYDCGDCPYRNECITEKGKNFKRLKSDKYEGSRRRMKQKMDTEQGRAKYKTRGKIVEHPFGDIKANMGFRGFLTRGKTRVKTEFKLACIAHNIKRIASFISRQFGSIKNYLSTVRMHGINC